VYWHDVINGFVENNQHSEVKIVLGISGSAQTSSISLGAPDINRIKTFGWLVPRTLHLKAEECPLGVNGNIIGKPITDWPQDSEATLEEFGHHSRFGDVCL
jgi:hypothetical protein